MRMIAQFEDLTGAGARDCVVDDKFGRILFVINPGEMGLAIGKKGASIKKASDAFGKKVEVVEYNPDKVQFIRNCFLPVQVMTVTFEEDEDGEIAYVEVRDDDRGLAIGKEGRKIIRFPADFQNVFCKGQFFRILHLCDNEYQSFCGYRNRFDHQRNIVCFKTMFKSSLLHHLTEKSLGFFTAVSKFAELNLS